MVSTMPGCQKTSEVVRSLLCGLGLLLLASTANAAGFYIRSAGTELQNEIYRFNASVDYHFSSEALNALNSGIPLAIKVEVEINKHRSYWLDETVASLTQFYQIRYQPVSQLYLIKNVNSGAVESYTQFADVLTALGAIGAVPLFDKKLLRQGAQYTGRVRAFLDTDELPIPLRVMGYVWPSWHMNSEWYVWPIQD